MYTLRRFFFILSLESIKKFKKIAGILFSRITLHVKDIFATLKFVTGAWITYINNVRVISPIR